jgi:hypothetical protein
MPSQGDTWEWQSTAALWRKLPLSFAPNPREGLGLVFDAFRGRVVLFGGGYASVVVNLLGDTWEYTPAAGP